MFRYREKHFFPLLFTLIIGWFITFLTIGFSAFQESLRIDGLSADVRIDKDIRIMGVNIKEVNEAVSTYEEYNVSNITSNISLFYEDSYIIYNVPVYNLENVLMGLKKGDDKFAGWETLDSNAYMRMYKRDFE